MINKRNMVCYCIVGVLSICTLTGCGSAEATEVIAEVETPSVEIEVESTEVETEIESTEVETESTEVESETETETVEETETAPKDVVESKPKSDFVWEDKAITFDYGIEIYIATSLYKEPRESAEVIAPLAVGEQYILECDCYQNGEMLLDWYRITDSKGNVGYLNAAYFNFLYDEEENIKAEEAAAQTQAPVPKQEEAPQTQERIFNSNAEVDAYLDSLGSIPPGNIQGDYSNVIWE